MFLAVFVIILVEIGKNDVNEYFDFKSGADRFVSPEIVPISVGERRSY